MHPLVSVVIPSYNHEAFVGDTIRSILGQSYPDFEIVVTDDCSRDRTPDVIRAFADKRIDLEVLDRNCGASVAVNSAIRRSHGAFVCLLASDDYFLPGKLEKQVAFLKSNSSVAAVFGMPRFIDERGAALSPDNTFNRDVFQKPFRENLRSRAQWLRQFFFYGNCLCQPTAMIRRTVLDDVGLFDPRLANLPDFDLWVRLCMRHEIHVIEEEFTAMRIRDDNRNMSAARPDSLLRHMFELSRILEHYRTMPLTLAIEVFDRDLRNLDIDRNRPFGAWLAELALRYNQSSHALFGLETLFETCLTAEEEVQRLIELTGQINPFNLRVAAEQSGPPKANQETAIRRNQPCPCGSGLKYKHCHGRFDKRSDQQMLD
jgi:glycosyltransferase involved in cell wall biosynthesis